MSERLPVKKSAETAVNAAPMIEIRHVPFSGEFGHVNNARIEAYVTGKDGKKYHTAVHDIGGGSTDKKIGIIKAFITDFFETHGYVPRHFNDYDQVRSWAQGRGLLKGTLKKEARETEHFRARFERKSRQLRNGVEEKQWQYEEREDGVRTRYVLDRSERYEENEGEIPVEVTKTIVNGTDFKVKIVSRIRPFGE